MLRRLLYQTLKPPATVARDISFTTDLRMLNSFMGADGKQEHITLLGGVSRGSRRFLYRGATLVLVLYVTSLATLAAAFASALAWSGVGIEAPWSVLCLAGVAAFLERGSIRLTATIEVSISLVPTLVAAVLFGPLAAMAVAAASMLPDIFDRGERPYLRWVTYTSTRSITAGCIGLASLAVQGGASNRITALVIATAVGALIAQVLDIALGALTGHVRGNVEMRDLLTAMGPLALASVPLYAPVVAVVVIAYSEVSPLTLPLFLVPALAAQRLHGMYQHERALAADLLNANRTLERANLSFATALVATLDARDQYTAGHSAAVAVYARDIAAQMGLPETEQELAHLCGLVHDIGKIGLPAGLLEKEGPLSLEERRRMQEHSTIGERIVANVHGYGEIAAAVRHHHERVDGNGYPDGLEGEKIPLLARILGVADAYDAMTSNRPYRDAMPSRVARFRLAQAVGSQFDVAVVAAFEAILAQAPEEYGSGQSRELAPIEAEALPLLVATS